MSGAPPDFLALEIDDDTFVAPVQLQFRRTGPVVRVLKADVDGGGMRPVRGLQRVTGGDLLTDAPAWACPVEDSGAGISWLVFGGNAGVWLAAEDVAAPDPDDPRQLVDAYLLLGRDDLVLSES